MNRLFCPTIVPQAETTADRKPIVDKTKKEITRQSRAGY